MGTGVYIAIAIPGYSHFETVLENFMLFIGKSKVSPRAPSAVPPRSTLKHLPGYWLAIYEGISLTDHFLFKRGMTGYHIPSYDQPSQLPPGLAAIFAFCMGVCGMVLGMSQVWFVGPIALHAGAGEFGGDVGFELAFAFAAVTYAVCRPLEKRWFEERFQGWMRALHKV